MKNSNDDSDGAGANAAAVNGGTKQNGPASRINRNGADGSGNDRDTISAVGADSPDDDRDHDDSGIVEGSDADRDANSPSISGDESEEQVISKDEVRVHSSDLAMVILDNENY